MAPGAIMQAAYRQAVGVSVPSPSDPSTPDAPWWYDHIAAQVPEFASIGITDILGPPPHKTASGAAPGSDGYGLQDYYDIGSKSQAGSIPTRFGGRDSLVRLAAIIGFFNLTFLTDWVMHQCSSQWTYPPNNTGRFPKQKSYFWKYLPDGSVAPGYVARDKIAGPIADDFPFANPFSYQNSTPKGIVMASMQAAYSWLRKTLGLGGMRDDDTKGQSFQTVNEFVGSIPKDHKVIGEYDDGNKDNLNYWVRGTGNRCLVWDFALHYILEGMCNNNSRWDMRQLLNGGFVSINNFNAVTFVENPDTDTDGFGTVIWNKKQAYFVISTFPGLPCYYYKDWSTDDGCYGLKKDLNNYIWIHHWFANSDLIWRDSSYQYVVYERRGNCVCGINNNQYDGWVTVTVQTELPPNTKCHDVTGHNPVDCWTDGNSRLTFGIPPNNNGAGTVCFVEDSKAYNRPIPVSEKHSKTLSIIGGPGLDISNVMNGSRELSFRVYGVPTKVVFNPDKTGWNSATLVTVDHITNEDGYTSFILNATNLPDMGSPFEIDVTVTIPKGD